MPKRDRDRRPDRDRGPGPAGGGGLGAGDEDYDWIRYLGDGRPGGAPGQATARTASPPQRTVSRGRGSGGTATDLAAWPAQQAGSVPPAAPPAFRPSFDEYAAPLYTDQDPAVAPHRSDDEQWLDSDIYLQPLYPPPDGDPVGRTPPSARDSLPGRPGPAGQARPAGRTGRAADGTSSLLPPVPPERTAERSRPDPPARPDVADRRSGPETAGPSGLPRRTPRAGHGPADRQSDSIWPDAPPSGRSGPHARPAAGGVGSAWPAGGGRAGVSGLRGRPEPGAADPLTDPSWPAGGGRPDVSAPHARPGDPLTDPSWADARIAPSEAPGRRSSPPVPPARSGPATGPGRPGRAGRSDPATGSDRPRGAGEAAGTGRFGAAFRSEPPGGADRPGETGRRPAPSLPDAVRAGQAPWAAAEAPARPAADLDDDLLSTAPRPAVGGRDRGSDADLADAGRRPGAPDRSDRSDASRRPGRSGARRPEPGKPRNRRPELRPARRGPASGAGRPQKSRRGGPFRAVTRLPGKIKIIGSAAILVLAAVAVVVVLLPQQAHVVSAPASLGSYVREPASADATAAQFRQKVIAGASGEVQHVVAAVYERTTGPGTSAGPQIIVFIGGNLAGGATAGGLMDTFMASLHGSFSTSPGRLGGQAACANGLHGGPAECAWADGDTFGVIVSATQGAASLAAEMRLMRPLVERPAK